VGQGLYPADDPALSYSGDWQQIVVPPAESGIEEDMVYAVSDEPGSYYDFAYNGQKVEITYSQGPDRGIWAVEIDGQPYLDPDSGEPLTIDGYNATVRYDKSIELQAEAPGQHVLSLVNTGIQDPDSRGTQLTLAQIEVLPPIRQSNLGAILGLILGLEVLGILFAWLLGRRLVARLAATLDTRRSIILALIVYAVIAVWGFFIDSVVEFWLLAWMVAIVQGGSQALSRSLYASMSPAAKSGEFFGLFGIMEKFSAILGPLIFAAAATAFDSSRPAVLSLIVLFLIGIGLLTRVNVDEGRRVAREEDAEAGLLETA
jgi:hypothetical protein